MVMRVNVRAGTIKQIQRDECKRECVQRVVIDVSRSRRNRKTSNDHALLNKTNAVPETSAGAIYIAWLIMTERIYVLLSTVLISRLGGDIVVVIIMLLNQMLVAFVDEAPL